MKKIVFPLLFSACSFWAAAQKGAAEREPISGYSKSPVTTFASSGFGLRYAAAGLFSKAGWNIQPKVQMNAGLQALSQLNVVLDCDRVSTTGKTAVKYLSWMATGTKGSKMGPTCLGLKRCDGTKDRNKPAIVIEQPATDNVTLDNHNAAKLTGVSGCDLYK